MGTLATLLKSLMICLAMKYPGAALPPIITVRGTKGAVGFFLILKILFSNRIETRMRTCYTVRRGGCLEAVSCIRGFFSPECRTNCWDLHPLQCFPSEPTWNTGSSAYFLSS